jgi:hypothetical protein
MATFEMKRETTDGTTVQQVEGRSMAVEGHAALVYGYDGALAAVFAPGRWDSLVQHPESSPEKPGS